MIPKSVKGELWLLQEVVYLIDIKRDNHQVTESKNPNHLI